MSAETDATPPPITGETRLYPIVGDPIDQVGSPSLLNPRLRERGANAVVVPFHVPAGRLREAFAVLNAAENVGGILVTVPHKPGMAALMDELGEQASHTNAINVARRQPDGRWFGDTTDGLGFVGGLHLNGHDISGKTALLVGAGGAGSSVGHALASTDLRALRIFDTDTAKADRLVTTIVDAHPYFGVATAEAASPAGCDIVINATPTGMGADDPYPIDAADLRTGMLVCELITKPAITPLLAAARDRGCATQVGHDMIRGQADAILDFFGFKHA